jgi:hypothetical protein
MDPAELERWLDDELKRLPRPHAPWTLAPRVLQAVQMAPAEAQTPHSWLTWSFAQQLASLAALIVVVAAVAGLWLAVRGPLVAGLSAPVVAVTTRVDEIHQRAYDITLAVRVLWRVLEPFAVGVIALLGIMLAVCAAIGAALRNLAVGGTSA